MSNTINKENAVQECSQSLCQTAEETLSYESNAAVQDTYVACECGRAAAIAGGSLAVAFLLSRLAPAGRGPTIRNDTDVKQLMAEVDVAVKEGDLSGAVKKLDDAMELKWMMSSKEALQKRRRRIFGVITMLELGEIEIEKDRKKNDPRALLLDMDMKAGDYETVGYFKGAFKVWEEVAVKYRQQEDWDGFIKTSLKLNELVDKVFDKEIERASYRLTLWTAIARSYTSLGENVKAAEAWATVRQAASVIDAAEKGAARPPAPAEAGVAKGQAALFRVLLERAMELRDGARGNPAKLDAASRLYEMAAHAAEAQGAFTPAAVAYEQAARSIQQKERLTHDDLARIEMLYEGAACEPGRLQGYHREAGLVGLDTARRLANEGNLSQAMLSASAAIANLRMSGDASEPIEEARRLQTELIGMLSIQVPEVEGYYGVAMAAGVEGVARAARSAGAERREELEKAGKGREKKEGREEGRKGPEVRRK